MARILCIEDSQDFQVFLSTHLKEHSLTHVSSLSEAIKMLGAGRDSFDLILLDISLPDGNGMKVLPQMKELLVDKLVPVIVISSDDDSLTKVAAFGVGADDFVGKPPDVSELKARIEARLRWVKAHPSHRTHLTLGDLTMDLERMTVELAAAGGGRKTIELTPYEYKILKMMLTNPGQVFSRDQIVERAWGVGKHITSRTVDAHVSHLRKKLVKSDVLVETVLSAGYKIVLKEK